MQQPVSPVKLQTICIQAPARLHLGFLDLNGGLGRHFGSIGLAVDSHYTKISLTDSDDQPPSDTPVSDSIRHKITKLINQFYLTLGSNIPTDLRQVNLTIHSARSSHWSDTGEPSSAGHSHRKNCSGNGSWKAIRNWDQYL